MNEDGIGTDTPIDATTPEAPEVEADTNEKKGSV